MGYSISQEQYEKLERHKREDRLCAMSTGRGGCFNRATVRQTVDSWYYAEDRANGVTPHRITQTVCSRHAKTMPVGYDGTNFRVLSEERY
jgi:hypothetical protein